MGGRLIVPVSVYTERHLIRSLHTPLASSKFIHLIKMYQLNILFRIMFSYHNTLHTTS